ncbi:Permease of the drug/metabolite transporter (DMT) superfamily [Paraburkholderia fungorum]|uniref:Permease of the drug/metabolite transporter (DMT) superfamily n=1 Tax=Paraburkholderia fungorum TaxID=134537 RepID=A0A1H1JM32_9BURK|nr:Permease of the drug/metabolite transporter (DMT) superfamily [Paraburkholderia fungorum]
MKSSAEVTTHMMAKAGFGKGVILCLLATVSWGSLFPVMTEALRILDPFTFTTLRFGIAAVFFAALLWRREGRQAFSIEGRGLLTWLMGTLGFAGFGLLVFIGQRMAGVEGALIASVMMATQPMLSLLANWAIRRIPPRPLSFCFILLSLTGVLLVVTKGAINDAAKSAEHLGAASIIVAGALCWVIYTIGSTFFNGWSPYRYTTLTTLFGVLSLLAINVVLFAAGSVAPPDVSQLERVSPYLLYTACVPGVIGVLCWNLGVRIVTPVNGVLFMDVIPATAFAISACEGVVPVSAQIVGVACTASAIVLNNFYLRSDIRRKSRLHTTQLQVERMRKD